MTEDQSSRRQTHWAKTKSLTYTILVLWFIFALGLPWFARELDAVTFLGFKLGYYMIVQGSLIAFVLLIVVQNMLQDKIDDEYGMGEE